MGGVADANDTAVGGKMMGCVDHSAVCGGGGKSPKRGDGVRQGSATTTHHAHSPFTRTRLHALMTVESTAHSTSVMHCASH
jgi:hypothetical protein